VIAKSFILIYDEEENGRAKLLKESLKQSMKPEGS
jgi:hypothetical protein